MRNRRFTTFENSKIYFIEVPLCRKEWSRISFIVSFPPKIERNPNTLEV